jgi:hypothetical protein
MFKNDVYFVIGSLRNDHCWTIAVPMEGKNNSAQRPRMIKFDCTGGDGLVKAYNFDLDCQHDDDNYVQNHLLDILLLTFSGAGP